MSKKLRALCDTIGIHFTVDERTYTTVKKVSLGKKTVFAISSGHGKKEWRLFGQRIFRNNSVAFEIRRMKNLVLMQKNRELLADINQKRERERERARAYPVCGEQP